MRIIINADDLGSNETVNDAVFSLMSENKISSATIMANGPSFDDAVTRSKIYSDCSFGCHLNLTEYKPLTNSQILYDYGIVNDLGFTGNLRGVKKNTQINTALVAELEQQITKLYDYNLPISHLDSHQHIHTSPDLFLVLKKIQKKFKIRKVRISMNYYCEQYKPGFSKKLLKTGWNYLLRNYYTTKTTDFFTSTEFFVNRIKNNNSKTLELMCHPGSFAHKNELQILQSNWLNENDLQIMSYNEL